MFKAIIIVAAACMLVYLLRRNLRRAWYVLRTGDEHPDWEKLGGDYFIAPWGRREAEERRQWMDSLDETRFPSSFAWAGIPELEKVRKVCSGGVGVRTSEWV